MASITLSVPEELKREMSMFPELNWSAVARKAIVEKIRLLEKLDKALSKSRLSEEDTIALGRKVKRAVSKKFSKG
ncbi:MAG: hypothetical protein V1494_00765 [Candidatus Diapherotrites archaeon]